MQRRCNREPHCYRDPQNAGNQHYRHPGPGRQRKSRPTHRHGLFDLTLHCDGDLNVDCHHTIEDCGIALGTAIREALGDKAGIVRYGSCMLPMDETLALCAVDLGGRPYFVYDASFAGQSCGGMDVQMAREFFYAVSYSAMMNLHLKVLYGENDHHKLEAMYKAFAKALSAAARHDDRIVGVLSTKGSI